MGGQPGEIPAAGVRPSNDDDGHALARAERQRGHWPKKAVLIERIDRAHASEDSTTRLGEAPPRSVNLWPRSGAEQRPLDLIDGVVRPVVIVLSGFRVRPTPAAQPRAAGTVTQRSLDHLPLVGCKRLGIASPADRSGGIQRGRDLLRLHPACHRQTFSPASPIRPTREGRHRGAPAFARKPDGKAAGGPGSEIGSTQGRQDTWAPQINAR